MIATTRRPQRLTATPAPAPKNDAWIIPDIQCYEPEDGVFFAQMGPTGGKHGYPAITGMKIDILYLYPQSFINTLLYCYSFLSIFIT